MQQAIGWNRRGLFRALACGCLAGAMPGRLLAADSPKTSMTPDEALQALKQGNQEFAEDHPHSLMLNRERRQQIAAGQAPFAVIVGCSDSRVPPELVFTRGLGELFTIRVAGNSVDRTALGTIEYGVAELGCPLVVVMGHERCGAVQAAVKVVTEDARFPGAIGEMVAPIIPAVLRAQRQQGDLVANSVKENVRGVVRRLKEGDDLLSEPVKSGKLQVQGAYYSLSDGVVEFL
ncbi:MAG TPA: carbonic anhydrase [Acetobacteraceae bacterium]|nr:carbonic anhydrase [Acetobacteraceae bacterium]